mmetsp:Transcript_42212/g.119315  ORF Transcript_42212/g.119315 Transcript_42212/m.119315 type:complete len:212 (+) Transcript_42212:193-828(+)
MFLHCGTQLRAPLHTSVVVRRVRFAGRAERVDLHRPHDMARLPRGHGGAAADVAASAVLEAGRGADARRGHRVGVFRRLQLRGVKDGVLTFALRVRRGALKGVDVEKLRRLAGVVEDDTLRRGGGGGVHRRRRGRGGGLAALFRDAERDVRRPPVWRLRLHRRGRRGSSGLLPVGRPGRRRGRARGALLRAHALCFRRARKRVKANNFRRR